MSITSIVETLLLVIGLGGLLYVSADFAPDVSLKHEPILVKLVFIASIFI